MPYIAKKRLKFGDRYINPGEPVPVTGGRNYHRMEKLGSIAWSHDAAHVPTIASAPLAGAGQGIQINAGEPPATAISDVEIPATWRELHWAKQKALALQITPDAEVKGKDDAVAVIEAEIARRASAQDAPADASKDDVVEIPATWRDLPDDERIALADRLGSDMEIGSAEDADTIIELELEVRAKADG